MFHGGLSGNIVSLTEMLVTAPVTELAILLCFGYLESPPPSGGSACPVYKGWVGRVSYLILNVIIKANVVETKEMSI